MVTALLEEYKKSTIAYKQILKNLSQKHFEKIIDTKTEDKDCKSIKTITFHIVHSGYTYANYIHSISNQKWLEYNVAINNPTKGIEEINKMLEYTEKTLETIWYKTTEELDQYMFDTRWDVTYNFEQLMEHAIVHILRHRRQLEIGLEKLQTHD